MPAACSWVVSTFAGHRPIVVISSPAPWRSPLPRGRRANRRTCRGSGSRIDDRAEILTLPTCAVEEAIAFPISTFARGEHRPGAPQRALALTPDGGARGRHHPRGPFRQRPARRVSARSDLRWPARGLAIPALLPFGLTVEDLPRVVSKLHNRVIGSSMPRFDRAVTQRHSAHAPSQRRSGALHSPINFHRVIREPRRQLPLCWLRRGGAAVLCLPACNPADHGRGDACGFAQLLRRHGEARSASPARTFYPV